ncbi:hypothetical protein L195_g043053 [Trifolium pratense]|uniref:Uncharacterized protein n=1 Tax=Trifolium pratense TaxID=57577 RepID=A0A2K3M873_TRIPR|nr:hypothetical protein L195_g043053 [Trifolium pratense]
MGKLNTNMIEETGKMEAKRIDNNKLDISAIYAAKRPLKYEIRISSRICNVSLCKQ